MSWRGTALLTVAACLTSGRPAAGDPPARSPPAPVAPGKAAPSALTPSQAADAALAATKAEDGTALRALAARDDPDPWMVADELLARRQPDVAATFAAAAPRKDVEALPGFVAAHRTDVANPTTRAALVRIEVLLADAGSKVDPLATLSELDGLAVGGDPLGAVRRTYAKGLALRRARRLEDAVATFLAAADAAEALAWWSRTVAALDKAGGDAFRRSDFATALAIAQRRLPLEELRGDRTATAEVLNNIGSARGALGDVEGGLEALRRALRMNEELSLPGAMANNLSSIGSIECSRGEYREALKAQEHALTLAEGTSDKSLTATILSNLGSTVGLLGDFPRAIALQERALALGRELGEPPRQAVALLNLGNLHAHLGDRPRAAEHQQRALAIFETTGNRQGQARALESLGGSFAFLGEHGKAVEVLGRALALARDVGDRWVEATALSRLGSVDLALGDFPRALERFEQALSVHETTGDHAGAAIILNNIAVVYARVGDDERAHAYQERALRASEAAGDRASVALSLTNMGADAFAAGDYAECIAYLERALVEHEQLGTKAGSAHTLQALGTAYTELGDAAKSLACLEQAAALAETLRDPENLVGTLAELGLAQARFGAPAKALETTRRALTVAEEVGSHPCLFSAHRCAAMVHLTIEELRPAAAHARRAVEESAWLVEGLAEQQAATVRGRLDPPYGTGAWASARLGDAEGAYYFLERGRAGALLEALGGRASLAASVIPAPLREEEVRARADEAKATALLRTAREVGNLADVKARRRDADAARTKLAGAVERIQRQSKRAASALYPTVPSLEAVRGWLREGEALVEYALDAREALALVITRAGARIVFLGAPSRVEAAVAEIVLADVGTDPAPALDRLRALVVDALALDPTIRTVLVSPDQALAQVPFALLLGDRDVAYVPSGTTYGLLVEERSKRGAGVLALGDPDYATGRDAAILALRRRGGSLVPLPGTRVEAKAVGDRVLLGSDATEAALRTVAQAQRWHAVHLACHGSVDQERPMLSSLALTATGEDDGFLTALDVFRMQVPADLVVLSACETGKGRVVRGEGLVGLTRAFLFAGASRVIGSLWKVDDEATRALMVRFYALWNPKDRTPPMGTAAALRAAQAYVRTHEVEVPDEEASRRQGRAVTKRVRPWAHPYYWAAWTLWGLAS